jgi:hypothetical protein
MVEYISMMRLKDIGHQLQQDELIHYIGNQRNNRLPYRMMGRSYESYIEKEKEKGVI